MSFPPLFAFCSAISLIYSSTSDTEFQYSLAPGIRRISSEVAPSGVYHVCSPVFGFTKSLSLPPGLVLMIRQSSAVVVCKCRVGKARRAAVLRVIRRNMGGEDRCGRMIVL
ncbi:hypothetical protein BJ912DRAFT_978240 [Pholiota molesta]|nr:hypothetical protein BJ912DRAFT_978240 [Pholiota molesta]